MPARTVRTARGAHIPLWDEATQRAIETEFSRRGKNYSGITTQRLSNLLFCGICHARMWVEYPGGYFKEKKRQWSCRHDKTHIRIKDSDLLPLVIHELTFRLENIGDIDIPMPPDETDTLPAALDELRTRKARILDAYETGALTLAEYSARTDGLAAQIETLEKRIRDRQNHL